ncbi:MULTISPECIES: hypothetical protein [Leisingera]|uniref:hypothetical protein n=1 Tax=Leisingera TaxID=191028 RepID=UPI000A9F7D26|nr:MULTISPECIES: hypothetical protein [Leisingera]MBY6068923.1 hypothetical protein [Leisingera aquaemixtae]
MFRLLPAAFPISLQNRGTAFQLSSAALRTPECSFSAKLLPVVTQQLILLHDVTNKQPEQPYRRFPARRATDGDSAASGGG